jgi:predicted Zn-dependent peptidase
MTARVHRLPNGVRVVADPMPSLESVALSVVIRGGARWEDATRNGWSHLLEHMVFKGAGDRSPRAIVEAIEAGGGNINAATGYERTSFQVRCLPDALPLAMEVLADLVRRPTLDADELLREIQVIGQEIAEAADAPDDRIFDLAQSEAFSGQALGRPILGTDATIGEATVETLRRFHQGLYSADRIVVSAAGAVDEDVLLRLAEAAFGDAAPAAALPEPEGAAYRGGAKVESRKLEQAQLVALFPGVSARDTDYFAMRLFAEVLGGGMSSRLFQEVRETRGLAYAIDAYAEHYEDTGVLGVYAGAAAEDARETAAVTAEEIRKLAERIEPAELARARAQARASLYMGRESPLARAEQAAGQLFLFDRLIAPAELAAGVEAVTEADIRRVGERVLSGRPTLAVLGPKRAGEAVKAFEKALS